MNRKIDLSLRFWSHVDFTDNESCWEWKASFFRHGYGQIKERKSDGPAKNWQAHRLSFLLANGFLPADKLVCHTCDNPKCVNPAHLFLGSCADNTADMVSKGRHSRKRTTAKLIPNEAIAIRNSKEPGWRLAQLYNVSQATISLIRHSRTWKNVEAD